MGDIVIRRDLTKYQTKYQIGLPGEPRLPFDEKNSPESFPGIKFTFLPQYTNEGMVTCKVNLAVSITDPQGQSVKPQFFPDHPRLLAPGETDGTRFSFTPQVAGSYTAQYEVFADNILSDSWQVVVCIVLIDIEIIRAPIEDPYYWAVTDFHHTICEYARKLLVNSYDIQPDEVHREYYIQTESQRCWSRLGFRSWYVVDIAGTRDGKPYIAVECGGCPIVKLRDLKTIFTKVIHIVGGTHTPDGDHYRAMARKENGELHQRRVERWKARRQRCLNLSNKGEI